MSGLTAAFSPQIAEANSNQEKLKEIQEKKSQNLQERQQKESEIQGVQEEQDKVAAEIKRLDTAVSDAENKIEAKQQEIDQTKENIAKLQEEIKVLEKRIAERDKLLKDRVKAMYQNGGTVDYLDVLMGAKSFGDFLERVMALNTIAEQDKNILEEHKADKLALEEKKAEVEAQLNDLEQKLGELEKLKADLNAKKAEKDALMKKLEKQEGELHSYVEDLKENAETLSAQEAAVKKEIARQKAAAEAAARKAAAEKAAREAAAAKKASSSNSNSGGGGNEPAPAPVSSHVGNSGFSWPTSGRVTSQIGSRWNKFHAGIDIAKSGSVPVRAAAAGTVFRSYLSGSYGNVVFITHYINGQTYTTVYAHMRNRAVSQGQTVSAGTYLGTMGNTGHSFGQHLHFELHKGSWNANKTNAVNPLNYLP
ncbi:peptidase M23 [Pseudalkalibacillus caeni]|uniref:Peptidase M23 n=2 Tax=Exobacillus caeni TaxID=2574798 RepID=A0A5R9F8D2_9BACL|nr:peptidase M23 [Pseudalkalibacillus caeni]